MLSIIIPSRSPQYLQKTVDDLLLKAEGEVEVIVVFDGIWPDQMLDEDKRVIVLHHGTVHNSPGMRESINLGVLVSHGEYIMKIDEHCMVDQGYDLKLIGYCEDNWIVIPRRYRLEPDTWEIIEDGRPPIDYMYVEYPYLKPLDKTQGLHGAEWKIRDREDILIDDTPTMQGSCYFMKRTYWNTLFPDGLSTEKYGPFTQEAQEISMSAWLSGGRVIVNKNTWYAHFHKGRRGKGYGFSNAQYDFHMKWNEKGRLYCINHWLNTKDYLHDMAWFVNQKFPDMPYWGDDWEERIKKDAKFDFSTTYIYANT